MGLLLLQMGLLLLGLRRAQACSEERLRRREREKSMSLRGPS